MLGFNKNKSGSIPEIIEQEVPSQPFLSLEELKMNGTRTKGLFRV